MNNKVSFIIPSRNEIFLSKTIDDIFKNARGEFEVIAVLDGYWPEPFIPERDHLVFIHHGVAKGMRAGINAAASIATGKYLLKIDAHCMISEGLDEVLKKDCEEDWVVIPRRYSLDPEAWTIKETGKLPIDYHYLSNPEKNRDGYQMHGEPWWQRIKERKHILIDDEMSSQGSFWFMHKTHFQRMGFMQEEGYGTFVQEAQEICNKTWLSGGRVIVNKNGWYAHLHKGKTYGRGYYISKPKMVVGAEWSARFWAGNQWKERKYDFEWLIEKFAPVPTWENWTPSKKIEVIDKMVEFKNAMSGDAVGYRFKDNIPNSDFKLIEPTIKESVMINNPIQEEITVSIDNLEPIIISRATIPDRKPHEITLDYIYKKFSLDPKQRSPLVIPNYGRNNLAELFAELQFKVGVEVGVCRGDYSEVLLKANPNLKLFGVDPWKRYRGYTDFTNRLPELYQETLERLKPYNFEAIRKFSAEAIHDFKDESLDFVYIDGNHEFSQVAHDLVVWSKKVRPGGIVSGHDYILRIKSFSHHVVEAVEGYVRAYYITPWFLLGRKEKIEGEIRDKERSFMWVKE